MVIVPVVVVQVGWVIVAEGVDGTTGAALITAVVDAVDAPHPPLILTVKVYEPLASPLTVPVVPEPVNVPDGLPVTVQLPVEGKPLNATLPVATVQVG